MARDVKIYGLGTISGDSITHPEYDPNYTDKYGSQAHPMYGTLWKSIGIRHAEYCKVEGVSIIVMNRNLIIR